ncbi:MAG: hypothetical protein KDK71_02615 [Chlamydiia bacterium]|nr:hypothetical protein [Chlamydiia bacterium]
MSVELQSISQTTFEESYASANEAPSLLTLKDKIKTYTELFLTFQREPIEPNLRAMTETMKPLHDELYKMLSEPQNYFNEAPYYMTWGWYLSSLHTLEEHLAGITRPRLKEREVLNTIKQSLDLINNEINRSTDLALEEAKNYPDLVHYGVSHEPTLPARIARAAASLIPGDEPPLVTFYRKAKAETLTEADFQEITTRYLDLKGIEDQKTPEAMSSFLFKLFPGAFQDPSMRIHSVAFWKSASEILEERLKETHSPATDIGQLAIDFLEATAEPSPVKTFEEERDLLIENIALSTSENLLCQMFGLTNLIPLERQGAIFSMEDSKERYQAFAQALYESIDENVSMRKGAKFAAKIFAFFLPYFMWAVLTIILPRLLESNMQALPKNEQDEISVEPLKQLNEVLEKAIESAKNGESLDLSNISFGKFGLITNRSLFKNALSDIIEKVVQSMAQSPEIDQSIIDLLTQLEQQSAVAPAQKSSQTKGGSSLGAFKPILDGAVDYTLAVIENPFDPEVDPIEGLNPYEKVAYNLLRMADLEADPENRGSKILDRLIVEKLGSALETVYKKAGEQQWVRSQVQNVFVATNQSMRLGQTKPKKTEVLTSARIDSFVSQMVTQKLGKEFGASVSERIQIFSIWARDRLFSDERPYVATLSEHIDASNWSAANEVHVHFMTELSFLLERIEGYENGNESIQKIYKLSQRLYLELAPLTKALEDKDEAAIKRHLAHIESLKAHIDFILKGIEENNTVKTSYTQAIINGIGADNINFGGLRKRAGALATLHKNETLMRSLAHRATLTALN